MSVTGFRDLETTKITRTRFKQNFGVDFRCPGCGAYYLSLADFTGRGGVIYTLGIAIKAVCHRCDHRFGVNQYWRKTHVINTNT